MTLYVTTLVVPFQFSMCGLVLPHVQVVEWHKYRFLVHISGLFLTCYLLSVLQRNVRVSCKILNEGLYLFAVENDML